MAQKQDLKINNFAAILYLIAGMAVMTAMDAVAKLMVEADYPVIQILAVRSWILVPLIMVLAKYNKKGLSQLKTSRMKEHLIRAVIGFLAPFLFFSALKDMPLADVTVLFFASPFIMTALSVPMFGEKVGLHRWLSILIGFGGVLVIVQPGASTFQVAAFWALGGCVAYSIIGLMIRWMSDTETTLSLVFYFNLGVGVIASVWTIFDWQTIQLAHLWMFGAMALFALLGQMLMAQAFSLGELSTVTPFEYTSLLWAVLFGFILWGDLPALNVWGGAAIIILCGLYIIYRERKKEASLTPPVTEMP